MGTLQGKGYSTKCLSLGGSRLSHMPISKYQKEDVEVEVEEEEKERRGTTANNRKRGRGRKRRREKLFV